METYSLSQTAQQYTNKVNLYKEDWPTSLSSVTGFKVSQVKYESTVISDDPNAELLGMDFVSLDNQRSIIRHNPDSFGTELGRTSDKYQLITNQYLFSVLVRALKEFVIGDYRSPIDEITVVEKSESRTYGARNFVEIQLGGESLKEIKYHHNDHFTMSGVGTGTQLAFCVGFLNSYDGKSSIKLATGQKDTFCLNGLPLNTNSLIKFQHSKTFIEHLHEFKKVIKEDYQKFLISAEQSQILAQTYLAPSEMSRFLERYNSIDDEGRPLFNDKLIEWLQTKFESEAKTRGLNVFSLQSALTSYTTYGSPNSRDSFNSIQSRESKIKPLFDGIKQDYLEIAA